MPDWERIKTEYITTDLSYRQLGLKYGIGLDTMQTRGTREKWVALRKKHKQQIVDKAARKVASEKASKLASLQKSADKMAGVIGKVLDDVDQFQRHIFIEGQGDGVTRASCKTMEKADTKGIRDLTAALKDLAAIMRNLYDLPTLGELEARSMAARRLALEERRADAGSPEDSETGVVEIAPVVQEAGEDG